MISSLTKNYYIYQFQHAKNRLNLLIHSFEIQQIIESHDLKGHLIFNHVCSISIKVTFSSLKYVQYEKNQPSTFMHLGIRVLCTFFTTTTQKLLKQFLNFLNLHQFAKNQLSSSIHLSMHLVVSVPQPFLTTPTPVLSINF